jgi:hypothetical protein
VVRTSCSSGVACAAVSLGLLPIAAEGAAADDQRDGSPELGTVFVPPSNG